MADQAQSLRVLADQLRSEHFGSDERSYDGAVVVRVANPPIRFEPTAPRFISGSAAVDLRLYRSQGRIAPGPRVRILAVTSGKGGVGKTNFSANLSITLGQRGKRVVMLDADMGLANAHIMMGANPRYNLEHVMHGSKSLSEVLHRAAHNVQLIAGGSGIAELANLSESTRCAFLKGLRELDTACDLIVIDTGAGVPNNVLSFLCAVNEIIVVTTPEPTAVANAYATIKMVSRENRGARLMLVVNMVHSSSEGEAVARRLSAITSKFLDLEVEYIGCIPFDPAVPRAVRSRTPFVSSTPNCAAATGINHIIRRLGYTTTVDTHRQSGMEGFVNHMQRFFKIGMAT